MGLWDTIKANTWDVAVYNLAGYVGPSQLKIQQEQIAADIARASGVGVGGKTVQASPEVVRARQAAAQREVDQHLKSQDAHPSQVSLRLPGGLKVDSLEKLRSVLVLVAALGVGAFFLVEFAKAYVSRRS